MNFLDINTMYCERGGGIRTFHHAKIDWFARHPEHAYYFVYPGTRARQHRPHDNVHLQEAPALPIGNAYRVLANYRPVWQLVRRVRPEVIECGDTLTTVAFCRLVRRLHVHRGLLAALWHSDPYETWVEPWLLRPGRLARARRGVARVAAARWFRRFRLFDLNVSTSRAVEDRLKSFGVPNVVRLPLGIDGVFFDGPSGDPRERRGPWTPERPLELLYAGRLDPDKGIDLVLAALPRLLGDARLRVTIMGRGVRERAVAARHHPRFRFLGYVASRREVAEIFRRHHVLLSPGPHETFGLSALEAMACGLVVVGTHVGGVGEFLRQIESPFRFAPWDVEGFSGAVMATLDADLAEHSRRARALAAEYGAWEDAIGRLVECYAKHAQRLTDGAHHGPRSPHVGFGEEGSRPSAATDRPGTETVRC